MNKVIKFVVGIIAGTLLACKTKDWYNNRHDISNKAKKTKESVDEIWFNK